MKNYTEQVDGMRRSKIKFSAVLRFRFNFFQKEKTPINYIIIKQADLACQFSAASSPGAVFSTPAPIRRSAAYSSRVGNS